MPLGKNLLLEVLRQEGVKYIFGNPGTTELPLVDALAAEDSIRYVLGLQESIVMGMADGYAQGSGQLSVASLHAAPGLGNAIGALHNAAKAGAPVLVTAGQQDLGYNFTEPNLWGDLTRIAAPFVKWSYEIHKVSDLPRAIHRAAKVALTPPTGPVFLSLPADLLNEETPVAPGTPTRVGSALRADRDSIALAARTIARARQPVIIAGDAVARSGAIESLVALAEAIGAPVYMEGMPNRVVFPPSHGLFRGPMGRIARGVHDTLRAHDLVVSIGGDLLTLAMPGDIDPMPEGMRIVHVDDDPWELGKNYPAVAAVWGDLKASLPELMAAVREGMSAEERDAAAERCAKNTALGVEQLSKLHARAEAVATRSPLHPLALSRTLTQALPANAVVVDESVTSGQGLQRFLKSQDPLGYFGGRGGGIGWGLAASVGIKLALPERPMVVLSGDGSAMYSIQALHSAAREKLGIVYVIANNRSYRIIKQRVHAAGGYSASSGRYVGVDLDAPAMDHVKVAQGFGLTAHRVETVADFGGALREALGRNTPTLIEVAVTSEIKDTP
jgi:benzoylformate decarboxylase